MGAESAGPHLLRVHCKNYDSADSYDRLADPRTRHTLHTLPADLGESTCTDLPSPGVAPLLVNESAGIVLGESSLLAYPTSS